MAIWSEADHPRDEEGKFTEKGGGTSGYDSDYEKMKRRADILYGSDEDYVKKYYGNVSKTDVIKRYEDNKRKSRRTIQERF